jgi:hypothetical protein
MRARDYTAPLEIDYKEVSRGNLSGATHVFRGLLLGSDGTLVGASGKVVVFMGQTGGLVPHALNRGENLRIESCGQFLFLI